MHAMARACLVSVAALLSGGAGWFDAYQQRAEDWLATQPPGTTVADFPLIDGMYKGNARLASGIASVCPATANGTISLGDRQLIFPYLPGTILVAPVANDGTLRARAGAASLEGRVGGGWLEFSVRTAECESQYRLRWTM